VRRTETNAGGTCCSAQVRGISKFTYPYNVAQIEGGVEGQVKNNTLNSYLF